MRKSTIATSIASVVHHVIASVVDAGVVRPFLTLTGMRDLMGLWQEQRQPRFAYCGCHAGYPWADSAPGCKPGGTGHFRPYGMTALAVSTASSTCVSAPANRLG